MRIAAISVDAPERNASMATRLRLPFPVLSDPSRDGLIATFDVADARDPREIAVPTQVLVDREGSELWRRAAADYADRPFLEETFSVAAAQGWAAVDPEPVTSGPGVPGPNAYMLEQLQTYYRGAKFAAHALGRRHPDIRDDTDRYKALMDHYLEAIRPLLEG